MRTKMSLHHFNNLTLQFLRAKEMRAICECAGTLILNRTPPLGSSSDESKDTTGEMERDGVAQAGVAMVVESGRCGIRM